MTAQTKLIPFGCKEGGVYLGDSVGRVEQSETRQRLPPTPREIVVVFQRVPKAMPTVSGFAITLYPTYGLTLFSVIFVAGDVEYRMVSPFRALQPCRLPVVNLAAMTEFDDQDKQLVVFDSGQNTVGAHPPSPELLELPSQVFTKGSGIRCYPFTQEPLDITSRCPV